MSHKGCAMRRNAGNRWLIVVFTTAAAILWMDRPAMAQCEAGQITSPEGEMGNGFGSVSLDGDFAAVSDGLAFDSLGAVFVYRRGGNGPADWELEATLMSPKPDPDDAFGAIAMSDGAIVVGAYNAAAPEFHRGAAYVYRYHSRTRHWSFEQRLVAADGDGGDRFGWSVTIHGDVILIGARDDVVDGVSQAGSAYVFRFDAAREKWQEEAKLTDPDPQQLDLFGQSVAIHGDVALVGAHADSTIDIGAGAAFVFRRDKIKPRQWKFEQQLTAIDAEIFDQFGFRVDLIENLAVIGAPQEDGQTGAAYVIRFDRRMRRWLHEAKLTAAEPVGPFSFLGASGSISPDGNTVLCGAPSDFASGFESGAAHLFKTDYERLGKWHEVAKLIPSDGEPLQGFGGSVDVVGDIAFVSGRRQSEDPGTVYIFDLAPRAGDLSCDGTVGAADLLALLTTWGPCEFCTHCAADLNGDCVVGVSDLLILLANWG